MPNLFTTLVAVWAWVCVGNVIYFIARWYWYGRQDKVLDNRSIDRAAVIESVKGAGIDFLQHVDALINQNHPCFKVIFCLSDTKDSAFISLITFFKQDINRCAGGCHITKKELLGLGLGGPGLESIVIVTAGRALNCSQKIYNQIRAYEELRPEDKRVAWVDADINLPSSWLNDLLYPIQDKRYAAVTGYRRLAPVGRGWSSPLISVINSSILTLLGDKWRNSLWGGSMAMTRQTFDKFKIPEYVSRCFTDDESVGALLKKHKIPIYFSYGVLPHGKVRYGFNEMLNFGRRQYLCARLYYKFHIFIALLFQSTFIIAFLLLLIKVIAGTGRSDILLFYGLISAMAVRGVLRFGFVRFALKTPDYGLKCLFFETIATPLTHLIHLMICSIAMVGNRVEWAKITYKLRGGFNVKRL